MQVTYRIPSKKVPYGYIEIVDTESYAVMPSPEELAADYADYIKRYQSAEVAAFEAAPKKPVKLGPADDSSVDEATKILNEGLGGTTEVGENDPAAPWAENNKPAEPAEKAWEADESDWDFG